MSSTLRAPRIGKGLLQRAAASVLFLPISLGLNVPLDASNRGLASQGPRSVLCDSPQQAVQGSSPADSAKLVLTDGTPVRLKFVRAVVSSQVIAGERVPLEVVEPVLAGNLVALPKHASAEATVTMAQAGRSMGRGGNLVLKIESVRLADGETVPVRAIKDVKGGGGRQPLILAGMAAGIAYWPASPLGFLVYVRGKNATIPAGTEITAYITGNFPLEASKFQIAGASPQQKDVPK